MSKVLLTLLGLILVGSVYGDQWLVGCINFCLVANPVPDICISKCVDGQMYPTPEGYQHSRTGKLIKAS